MQGIRDETGQNEQNDNDDYFAFQGVINLSIRIKIYTTIGIERFAVLPAK